MKNLLIFLCLCFSLSTAAVAQNHPKLTGTVEISINQGTLAADLKLENIPRIKDYLILLNAGLNIQYFRNEEDNFNYGYNKVYDLNYSYESFGYYMPDSTGKSKFLPPTIQFKYTGKFPVIDSLDKASDVGDWKGNIAFNGKTIRTDGAQAAWYPVLYDIEKDKRYESLVYDIEVICRDCQSIYVNGSKPISAAQGRFKRTVPSELTLFAGNYVIQQHQGSYYLNSGLAAEQMKALGNLTSTYIQFLEQHLSIPYGENVVYIQTTPVSKNNAWLFVSYPSIYNIDHSKAGLKDLFDEEKSKWFRPFIVHELAHYYFGTYRRFNSELGDMLDESFSEYVSLKLTKTLISEHTYFENIKRKLNELNKYSFTTFKEVKSASDYGNRNLYVYNYAPIIWLALEQELGEKKMWQWLNKMLTTPSEKTDYQFLIARLREVVNDENTLNRIIEKYLANSEVISEVTLPLNKQNEAMTAS